MKGKESKRGKEKIEKLYKTRAGFELPSPYYELWDIYGKIKVKIT